MRDVDSTPTTLARFIRPGSPAVDSFLLSTARESLLFFNLSDCSAATDSLPWLTLAFFGAADVGEGLVERVSRRLCGKRFVSLSGEVSMGSSAVDDLGLGVPLFTPVTLGVLNLP